MGDLLPPLADGARTALGFFWKAGWAFVLGYFVSALIQAFVPKGRLTRFMGDASPRSVALSTLFGAASSSCSFAALSAARALVMKGAHFVAAVAFMFASTNLVIELGILILIFLGWPFLGAELIGGVCMIVVSALLIRWTYPRAWLRAARKKVEEESPEVEEDFDWRERIVSREGWRMVGRRFTGEWGMVWEEIVIGFTVAGFVAALVPPSWWSTIFLLDAQSQLPEWLVVAENAAVAPFVAAATFIGSMGNIPLATVLSENGVLFAGVMGFIYSDLMVPPLVAVNAKYYGWRVALYIAAVMFVSIFLTAVSLHVGFEWADLTPSGGRAVEEVVRFELDYTFWLNILSVSLATWLIWLSRRRPPSANDQMSGDGDGHERGDSSPSLSAKRIAALLAAFLLVAGTLAWLLQSTNRLSP